MPLVSVITPVYNGEVYLDKVIRSVLEQDYPNVEHIVLDDGSTDSTFGIVKSYDGKIRWSSHESVGKARTINKGFSMSRGAFVGVVNPDEPLLPGAVSAVVERLLANPETLVAYPDWLLIDGNGNTIGYVEAEDYDYLDMLRWHHCLPGPGAFFRRSVLSGLGGWDQDFRHAGDFDFWLRAGLLGPFVRIPGKFATRRVRRDIRPSTRSAVEVEREMAEEHVRLVRKVYAVPNLPGGARKVEREAYSSACYVAGTLCKDDALSIARRRYFLRALRYAPLKYVTEYEDRLRTMLPAVLGWSYGPFWYAARFPFRGLRAIRRHLGS